MVYWDDDDEDEEAANACRYREGGFSVFVQAQARGPKTASLPVLGVEFDDLVRDSDEETDAVRAQDGRATDLSGAGSARARLHARFGSVHAHFGTRAPHAKSAF